MKWLNLKQHSKSCSQLAGVPPCFTLSCGPRLSPRLTRRMTDQGFHRMIAWCDLSRSFRSERWHRVVGLSGMRLWACLQGQIASVARHRSHSTFVEHRQRGRQKSPRVGRGGECTSSVRRPTPRPYPVCLFCRESYSRCALVPSGVALRFLQRL